jgi:hypothetical protein
MKTFEDLKKERGRISVRSYGAAAGAGTLILDGARSQLILSTNGLFEPTTDVNGWFDLKVRHGRETIWLHNALVQMTSQHSWRSSDCETQIFPNYVIFNANSLGRSNRIAWIAFRIAKLKNFFHHGIVEWQSLYEAPKDVLSAIKKLRKRGTFARTYDFYKPETLYLVHKLPRVMSFKVEGRQYEIGWGLSTRGPTWDSIALKAEPYARISFPKLVDIEQATDFAWAWMRLFSQLAMEHLDIISMSVAGRRRGPPTAAEVYLPNNAQEERFERESSFSFGPGEAPLSRWKERGSLSKAMQSWISREDARSTFRVSVDTAIANLAERTSLQDIVTLCSAIESLDELKSDDMMLDSSLDAIANGAIQAAAAVAPGVDPNRVRGVINLLRHRSLPQRLKLVLDAIAPHITNAESKKIRSGTLGLRAIAAHGGPISELSIPRVRPIVVALAGVCVLYDALTSGFPTNAGESRRLRALRETKEALQWIAHLEERATGSA